MAYFAYSLFWGLVVADIALPAGLIAFLKQRPCAPDRLRVWFGRAIFLVALAALVVQAYPFITRGRFDPAWLLSWTGGVLVLFLAAWLMTRMRHPLGFWLPFILVNLMWWPLLAQTAVRVWFFLKHGGMDCVECNGSPMAFLIHFILEQIYFLPLGVAMAAGVAVIWQRRRHPAPDL